jgi:hypothetical protein
MFGQRQRPVPLSATSSNDPNEMLRRIDQQTTMIYHWVRAGFIATILLLIVIVVIG